MIYVILGTTASGKTELAVELARHYHLPLIGADAYQIYRELKLGTARPSAEELEGLTHHQIGIRSIKNPITVAQYQKETRALLEKYQRDGQDVIISGGTFLYVRATLFNYSFPDEEGCESRYSSLADDEVFDLLKARDPTLAAKFHPHNRRRVERALTKLDRGEKAAEISPELLYPAFFFEIERSPDEVEQRIKERTEQMFSQGLIDEVSTLLKDPENMTTAFQAIGYKEVREGLERGWTKEQMCETVALKTRQYAKRQRTFLRHQFPNLRRESPERIRQLIAIELQKKSRTILFLGPKNYSRLERSSALVVGLGGVGAAVASALARLGVKKLCLVDNDSVEGSNLNRQELYTFEDVGRRKVEAAAAALRHIDPLIEVTTLAATLEPALLSTLDPKRYSVVFDCIDDVPNKVELCCWAAEHHLLLILASGTGRRLDVTKLRCGTLFETGDPLARAVKRKLKERGLDPQQVKAVYSIEQPAKDEPEAMKSLPMVPIAAGLAMVSYFVELSCQSQSEYTIDKSHKEV